MTKWPALPCLRKPDTVDSIKPFKLSKNHDKNHNSTKFWGPLLRIPEEGPSAIRTAPAVCPIPKLVQGNGDRRRGRRKQAGSHSHQRAFPYTRPLVCPKHPTPSAHPGYSHSRSARGGTSSFRTLSTYSPYEHTRSAQYPRRSIHT